MKYETDRETDQYLNEMASYGIPTHCREGLVKYIVYGVPTGGFLRAVLSNDLKETYATADDTNGHYVRNYVQFLYSVAPSACWGSPEKYEVWIKIRGLKGVTNA